MSDLKDSGLRHQFSTGAVRDGQPDRGCFNLFPWAAAQYVARQLEKGKIKYTKFDENGVMTVDGARNWERGIPLSSFVESGMRHKVKINMGFDDEDHWAADAWNSLCGLETKIRIEMGILPATLNDLPTTYKGHKPWF